MRKRYIYLALFFIGLAVLLPATAPVLALEVTYPNIGGYSITSSSTFIQYIEYFFALAVALSGIVAIISLVISGVQILAYGGSPQALGEAKERFTGSVLGIALLFASFIILQNINPQLTSLNLTALPQQGGGKVFLDTIYTKFKWDNSSEIFNIPPPLGPILNYNTFFKSDYEAPKSVSNMEAPLPGRRTYNQLERIFISDGAYYQIRYKCTPPANGNKGANLLVWVYRSTGFTIDADLNGGPYVNTFSLPCNESPTNVLSLQGAKSYKWAYEEPGVYFYLKPVAQTQLGINPMGISSDVYTDPGSIEPFQVSSQMGSDDEYPVSMRIVNSQEKQYGVVLNESVSDLPIQECSYPYFNKDLPTGNNIISETKHNIDVAGSGEPFNTRYADVFKHTPTPIKGSISFYSENLFTKIDAGDFEPGGRAYHLPANYYGNVNKWIKEQGNPNPQNAIPGEDECSDSDTCLKSIEREAGSYRVILYGGNETNWEKEVCQQYTCQQNNFGQANTANRWIFNNSRKVYDMYIIPMPGKADEICP